MAEADFPRRPAPHALRVAFCAQPEDRPVDPEVAAATSTVAERLAGLGHAVETVSLDFAGWTEAFGPLVVAEEWRERGHRKRPA